MRDARRTMRLVGECRDLGADPSAWHQRLVIGLCELTGSQVGIGANLRHFERGRTPVGVSIVRQGWDSPQAEQTWNGYVTTVPVQRTPEYSRLVGFRGEMVTRTRPQLYEDTLWYRSETFNRYHRACGIDQYVFSIRRVRGTDLYNSVWIHRPLGEPAYSRREWWIVRLVHGEVGRLIGGALAAPGSPGLADLPPRQRQTLDALLGGDSEKQVAARLGLSRATVHEYVTALHRHFGVSSRGELLSLFVGRGGRGAGRADPSV
jgi:DNA-binding CsgD family transcriptional regulator